MRGKVSLLGAGGMAKEILSFFGSEVKFLFDNVFEKRTLYGHSVDGIFREDEEYIMGVGYPSSKKAILDSIGGVLKFADPLVHMASFLGGGVRIGKGAVVFPFVAITADTTIGEAATLNTGVIIGHDCRIGNLFHACPGAVVSGNVTIGDMVFVGANACIKEKVSICDNVVIGAGAVVLTSISVAGVYVGCPARRQ